MVLKGQRGGSLGGAASLHPTGQCQGGCLPAEAQQKLGDAAGA